MRLFFALFFVLMLAGCGDNKPVCQKESTCFDKRSDDKKLLLEAISKLKEKSVNYECRVIPSKYMLTQNVISKDDLQKMSEALFGTGDSTKDGVRINCAFYENDKLDPGKKSSSCKLFAGYLLYEFYYKDTLIYKIQIDVNEAHGEDIQKRLECIKESILAL